MFSLFKFFALIGVASATEDTVGEYIVVLKSGSGDLLATQSRYSIKGTWSSIPGFRAFLTDASHEDLEYMTNDPGVDYFEINQPVYTDGRYCPSTETGPQSWGQGRVTRVNGTGDYRHDPTWGSGVDLYVIDTGVNCEHEEFANTECTCGPTFAGGADGCTDGNSHGTFCASIAAGDVYGIAKSSHIIGVKVLSDSGMGSTAGVISGMDFVASRTGNRVASMSLGGSFSQASNDAADALVRSGVALAIAAGNDNEDACRHSPASAPLPICVGSTDKEDQRSFFSNYGSCTDIFAPGSDITGASSEPGTYVTGSGTSMAAPHVAGVLAALRGLDPNLSPRKLKRLVLTEASDDVISDVGDGSPNRLLHLDCSHCSDEVRIS